MSDETHGIPQGGNGGLIATGLLFLVGAGGLVFWKLSQQEVVAEVVEPPSPALEAQTASKPTLNDAPPPPPEEPAAEAGPLHLELPKAGTKSVPAIKDSCEGDCEGTVTPTLRSALAQRALSARNCYNTALRRDSSLQGKLTVAVRIDQTGRACSVQITESTLGDASVDACVAEKFRSGGFSAVQGDCVNVAVPINFTKEL